jgi:hypothetical protein
LGRRRYRLRSHPLFRGHPVNNTQLHAAFDPSATSARESIRPRLTTRAIQHGGIRGRKRARGGEQRRGSHRRCPANTNHIHIHSIPLGFRYPRRRSCRSRSTTCSPAPRGSSGKFLQVRPEPAAVCHLSPLCHCRLPPPPLSGIWHLASGIPPSNI